jgi:hypothetical protein
MLVAKSPLGRAGLGGEMDAAAGLIVPSWYNAVYYEQSSKTSPKA